MENKNFSTKDFNEAAILLTFKIPLLDVFPENGICIFVFADCHKAISLTESLWRGNLEMNIREFISNQRLVKDLIRRSLGGHQDRNRIPGN
jgi:hypothetical protein